MTLEAAAVAALEKSLTTAANQLGKRLWTRHLSPAAKRERISADLIKQLMGYDFSGRFRLSVILPALPAGISLTAVKSALESPAFHGLLHELVAARLLSMPKPVVVNVRENMRLATRLEFPDADAGKAMAFGEVLFDEIDRVVAELVTKLDTLHLKGLAELRQSATVTLTSPTGDNIKRHNQYLRRTVPGFPRTTRLRHRRARWTAYCCPVEPSSSSTVSTN